jgi:DDE superfamily endonuclease
VLAHHFNWQRASIAAALCFGSAGGGCRLAFHVQPGSYDTQRLIGVLQELRRFLGGQKATLVWDGLPAHRSKAMQAFVAGQRHWLVVERLPGYAPELNPTEALWGHLKGRGGGAGLPCRRHPPGGHRGRPAWHRAGWSHAASTVCVSSSQWT